MSIKKLLLIFAGLCLVVLIGLICAMRSATFDGFIKQKIISAAAPVVRLSIGDFILSGASFEATKLEGFVPKLFLSFAIDRLKLQSSIFSIIFGSPNGQASLEAYNGKLAVEVSEVGATRTVIKKISGSNFDLSSHSQLSSLGIDAGQLSFDGSDLELSNRIENGRLEVELNQLSLARDNQLIRLLGLIPDFLPPIENAQLKLPLVFKNGLMISDKIYLTIGLAQFKGHGQVRLDSNPQSFSLEGEVTLSQEGLDKFGPLLPAISAGKLAPTDKTFRISGSGSKRNPKWTISK